LEVSQELFKKEYAMEAAKRWVGKVEKGYNKTLRRVANAELEVYRKTLGLETCKERETLGVEDQVIKVAEERYILHRQCFSRHGRALVQKKLKLQLQNATKIMTEALEKCKETVTEKIGYRDKQYKKYLDNNLTIAPNVTEYEAALDAQTRVWRVLRAVKHLDLKLRQVDPGHASLAESRRALFYAEVDYNKTSELQNYHRRVMEHYLALRTLAESKNNRTQDKLYMAQERANNATTALENAMEEWSQANTSLLSHTRRHMATDEHHAGLVPSVTIGEGVSIVSKKSLIIGHVNDSGVTQTQGAATLRARAGVVLGDSIIPSEASYVNLLTIDADYDEDGQGSLRIAPGAPLSSSGALHITASDLDIQDTLSVKGGALHISGSKMRQPMALGDGEASQDSEALQLNSETLSWISAPLGSVFGGTRGGHIEVGGVAKSTSQGLGGVLTLVAGVVGAQVRFDNQEATFRSLSAQAYSGIVLHGNTTTVDGDLRIDGDSQGGDSQDSSRGPGLTLSRDLRLEAASKMMIGKAGGARVEYGGKLTLLAGNGLDFNVSAECRGPKGRSEVHMNADTDSDGAGKIHLGHGGAWRSNGNDVHITASDIDVHGEMNVGLSKVSIHSSKPAEIIAVGGSEGAKPRYNQQLKTEKFFMMSTKEVDMHLDDAELSRFKASGLSVGSSTNGNLMVQSITNSSTKDLGLLTLKAMAKDTLVSFTDEVNVAKGLTVQAEGGLIIQRNLTSEGGEVRLRSGTGALNINRKGGIDTTGEELFIEADQMVINGEIHTGLGATTIDCVTGGNTLGLGYGTGNLQVTGDEMQKIHTTGISMGGYVCGNVIVNHVEAHHGANIEGIFTLAAVREDSHIIVGDAPSSFNALVIQADNGIFISGDLSTTSDEFGILTIDGDMHEDERINGTYKPTSYTAERKHRAVVFADGLTVTAKMTLSLGGVWEEKRIRWKARQAKKDGLDKDTNVTTEELTVVNQKAYVPLTVGGNEEGGTPPAVERMQAMRAEMDYYGGDDSNTIQKMDDDRVDEPLSVHHASGTAGDGGTEIDGSRHPMIVTGDDKDDKTHEKSTPPPQAEEPSPPPPPDVKEETGPAQEPSPPPPPDVKEETGPAEEMSAVDKILQEASAAVDIAEQVEKQENVERRIDKDVRCKGYCPPVGEPRSPVGEFSLVGECIVPRMYRPKVYVPRPMCDLDGSVMWWG